MSRSQRGMVRRAAQARLVLVQRLGALGLLDKVVGGSRCGGGLE
jgi:hypothetical protein